MSKNISGIYSSNPATSMQTTDLMYLGRSATDMAILYSNLASSVGKSLNVTGYTVYNGAVNISLNTPLSAYNKVSISASGKTVTLPAANTSTSMPVGASIVIENGGSNSFDLYDNGANFLLTVNPIDRLVVTLLDNSTAAGTYRFNYLGWNSPIVQGFHYISARGYMSPAITNGCSIAQLESSTNKNNVRVFQFASGVTNIAIAQIPLESSISKSSFTIKPIWSTNTATSGNLSWYVDAIFRKTGDSFDTAYGSQQTISASAASPAGMFILGSSVSVTPSYPSGSAGNAGVLELRIQRKSGDTIADTVNLIDVEVGLTITAGTDNT